MKVKFYLEINKSWVIHKNTYQIFIQHFAQKIYIKTKWDDS